MTRAVALITFCLVSALAHATSIVVPLNTSASSVKVTFCLLGKCDDDTSPVGGSVTLDLDSINAPTQATLDDFTTNVLQPIDIFIQVGPGSSLTATASNAVFSYATPGVPNGPVAITAGSATFLNVLTALQGNLNYTASGLACSLLTQRGYPCSDVIDLSTLDPANADQIVMAISSVNRTVSISTHFSVTTLLDPNSPDLGTVTVDSTLVGSVFVPLPPCPPDLTGDRAVDLSDIAILLSHYGATNATPAQGDLDGNQIIDLADLAIMLSAYGKPCPT